jgi:hypothetical protein
VAKLASSIGKTTIDIHIEMIFNGNLWISMAILLYWSSSPVTLKIDFHPYIYSNSPKNGTVRNLEMI